MCARAPIHMDQDMWSWLILAELILVELPLFIVDYGAVTDLFYVSSLVLLVWRIVAFVIDALAWGVLVYFSDAETSAATTVRNRGNAWMRSQVGYFIVPMLVHLLVIAHWIPFRIKFAGLSPLDFYTNLPAFEVQRSIQLVSEALFALVLAFWYFDGRHKRLHTRITFLQRANGGSASANGSSPQ